MRNTKSQKGNSILTEEQEIILVVWNDLKKMNAEMRKMKEWMVQC